MAAQGIYAVTYDLGPSEALDAGLERDLTLLARSLRRFALPESGLLLLHRLFDRNIDGRAIHALFARLGAILVRDDPGSLALYAPIETCPVLRSAFPLHADLSPATTLLTVFNDLPPDESGASLLVSFQVFDRVLEELALIPASARARVHDIRREDGAERYEEFVDLLYRPDRPWRDALLEALARVRFRIRLGPGEGYILDDRTWLHGRELQSVPVSSERLQRLVFAPIAAEHRP